MHYFLTIQITQIDENVKSKIKKDMFDLNHNRKVTKVYLTDNVMLLPTHFGHTCLNAGRAR